MVMGNLCVHKGERVRQLAENAGFELIYLPPYSPDLNSIEEAFAKLKALPAQSRDAYPRGARRGDGPSAGGCDGE